MQTIQINNPEVESFIASRYGSDTQSFVNDFIKFVKLSLDDVYPAITKEEAKKRVAKALQDIKSGEAVLLSQKEYDKEIDEFMKTL
ncbi:MAG: hypothetical protein PHQ93_08420 [Sulfurimonas sp.]|uniref:hypothetical protein n=1 Tax=Sulfurimonas sp. TaxID=2022749 RepID=UPI00262BB544|nr:hypothetical protein [Sulfurimonas sp.]MDD5401195.1 hypothetical protein [Sulfurimonas sp.]